MEEGVEEQGEVGIGGCLHGGVVGWWWREVREITAFDTLMITYHSIPVQVIPIALKKTSSVFSCLSNLCCCFFADTFDRGVGGASLMISVKCVAKLSLIYQK